MLREHQRPKGRQRRQIRHDEAQDQPGPVVAMAVEHHAVVDADPDDHQQTDDMSQAQLRPQQR